jgi:uncharacterized membrane protein YccC
MIRFVSTLLLFTLLFTLLWLFYRHELRRLAWALPLGYLAIFAWNLYTRGLDDRLLRVLAIVAGAAVLWLIAWTSVGLIERRRRRQRARQEAAFSPGRGGPPPPGDDPERPAGSVRP